MRYLKILIAATLLLLVAACDRFEHSFKPSETVEHELLLALRTALTNATAEDIGEIEALYHEDYLHGNIRKEQRMQWYQAQLERENVSFEISQASYEKLDHNSGILSWQIKVYSGEELVAQESFEFEKIIRENAQWQFYGNQIIVGIDESPQLIIAEYFTFRTCPNCPPAEEKLQALQAQYPDWFIYLEHHVNMELAIAGDDTYAYYGAWSQPSAVFQGQEKVNGSTAESLEQYHAVVDAYLGHETPVYYTLKNIQTTANTLSGEVELKLLKEIDLSDAMLNYVIISDEDHYTNYAGEPLHNVVRALGSKSLAGVDLSEPIAFELSRETGLPPNFTLVVFAQHKPTTFANNATIYGGVKKTITR